MPSFYFFPLLANSSSDIKVVSTEHGIILYSMVTYHTEELGVGWLHKYVKSTLFTLVHTNMNTTVLMCGLM